MASLSRSRAPTPRSPRAIGAACILPPSKESVMRIAVRLVIVAALVLCVWPASAQTRPSYTSPEIHPDRTITFRYYAPDAKKVAVRGELGGKGVRHDEGRTGPLVGRHQDHLRPHRRPSRVDGVAASAARHGAEAVPVKPRVSAASRRAPWPTRSRRAERR